MFKVTGLGLMVIIVASLKSNAEEVEKETDIVEEYCNSELFQPQCLKNEAILMRSATYGRMRIGRCITAEEVAAQRSLAGGDDPRILGCSADVLSILDRTCSGKITCDIRVGDISSESVKPCVPGLTVYLEVSYECISIADEGRSCSVSVSTNPVHIIGSSSSGKRCGFGFQPWSVEAPSGQKILITLTDISSSISGEIETQSKQPCFKYGTIVDKVGKTNASICVDGEKRENHLYESVGNSVQIFFTSSDGQEDNDRIFILKLKPAGCSDIIPPEDTWLKRNDKIIIIGCYMSHQTWHLRCEEGSWIGVFGNCSIEFEGDDLIIDHTSSVSEAWNDGQVLAVVAISGFTVVICLTILCLGIVCLRRFSVQSKNIGLLQPGTLKHSINLSNGSNLEQRIPFGVPVNFHDDEMISSFNQQIPTYSVSVGENDQ